MAPVWGIILAAGHGKRFSGAKLMVDFRGQPLAAHAAGTVARAVDGGILSGATAVVPAGDQPLATLFSAHRIGTVDNAEPEAGLARSLQIGITRLAAVASGSPSAAALVVLADQPLLRLEVIAELVKAWESTGRAVVRPTYADAPTEPGHPLLIDRSLWSLTANLTGDRGLLPLLAESPDLVLSVAVAGANPDIDTPADLAALEGPA